MRDIKFRAWSKNSKSMYEVFSFCDAYVKVIVGIGTASKLPRNLFEPLMQFTGLRDKNGVEIYEGDILGEKGRHEEDNIFVCEYISDEARYMFTSPYDGESFAPDEVSDLDIIGNIHENSNLLK